MRTQHMSCKEYRVPGLAAAGLALLLGAAAPASAAGTAGPAGTVRSSPVGRWQGTVRHGTGTDTLNLSFRVDGSVCLVVTDVPDGGRAQGEGTWRTTGPGTFSYAVKEWLYDRDGAVTGSVGIDQQAVQRAGRFESSGISKIYDAQGTYVGSTQAEVVAHRSDKGAAGHDSPETG